MSESGTASVQLATVGGGSNDGPCGPSDFGGDVIYGSDAGLPAENDLGNGWTRLFGSAAFYGIVNGRFVMRNPAGVFNSDVLIGANVWRDHNGVGYPSAAYLGLRRDPLTLSIPFTMFPDPTPGGSFNEVADAQFSIGFNDGVSVGTWGVEVHAQAHREDPGLLGSAFTQSGITLRVVEPGGSITDASTVWEGNIADGASHVMLLTIGSGGCILSLEGHELTGPGFTVLLPDGGRSTARFLLSIDLAYTDQATNRDIELSMGAPTIIDPEGAALSVCSACYDLPSCTSVWHWESGSRDGAFGSGLWSESPSLSLDASDPLGSQVGFLADDELALAFLRAGTTPITFRLDLTLNATDLSTARLAAAIGIDGIESAVFNPSDAITGQVVHDPSQPPGTRDSINLSLFGASTVAYYPDGTIGNGGHVLILHVDPDSGATLQLDGQVPISLPHADGMIFDGLRDLVVAYESTPATGFGSLNGLPSVTNLGGPWCSPGSPSVDLATETFLHQDANWIVDRYQGINSFFGPGDQVVDIHSAGPFFAATIEDAPTSPGHPSTEWEHEQRLFVSHTAPAGAAFATLSCKVYGDTGLSGLFAVPLIWELRAANFGAGAPSWSSIGGTLATGTVNPDTTSAALGDVDLVTVDVPVVSGRVQFALAFSTSQLQVNGGAGLGKVARDRFPSFGPNAQSIDTISTAHPLATTPSDNRKYALVFKSEDGEVISWCPDGDDQPRVVINADGGRQLV